MIWIQRILTLRPRSRGFHIVTGEILEQLPEILEIRVGLLHLFIQHTSASLTINENASPDVRSDMERHLDRTVPESAPHQHTDEGSDDMPAHIKSSLMGSGVTIPLGNGSALLGTWQGLYLGEHRNRGGVRSVVATVIGQER